MRDVKSALKSVLAALLLALLSWTVGAAPSSISYPAPGTRLTATLQTFTWNQSGAALYGLCVGNSVGAQDIGCYPERATTETSTTVTGLPSDGRTLYVRLYSWSDVVAYTDVTYTAVGGAAIASPADGSTLAGSSQLFQWNDAGASLYQVWVGNSPGTYDLGYFPAAGTTGTSTTVSGLPTDGRTLYVRLWSNIGGEYYSKDYAYTAASMPASPAARIASPENGGTLTGSTQMFQWNDAGASLYQVWVGNSVGAYDMGYYPTAGTTATSTTVTGLPTDGRTLYVRLWSNIGGVYHYTDATFTAATAASHGASLASPPDGSTLTSSTQTFQWNDAGASLYQVWVGNSVGAYDIGYYPAAGTTDTFTTVTGLPTDGRTLYVRLWSKIGGVYQYTDATFKAAATTGAPAGATISSPVNGAKLSETTQTFRWNDAGASLYQLFIGNTAGAYDLGYFPTEGTTGTSVTATGLPKDGRTLYARLYSRFASGWVFTDATFIAAGVPLAAAEMISPVDGSTLDNFSNTFSWTFGGATNHQLWFGNTPGAYDLGYFPEAGTPDTKYTVKGLPTDGRTIYVRLYSLVQGEWLFRDYTYSASPAFINWPPVTHTLPGSAQVFSVVATGSSAAELVLGSSPGSDDLGRYPIGPGPEVTATNIPTDGRPLHVLLRWLTGGTWKQREYVFATQGGPGAALMTPPNDYYRVSVSGQVKLEWNDVGAERYVVYVGSSPGLYDDGVFYTSGTSQYICIWFNYIRLWSLIGGDWYYRDYRMTNSLERDPCGSP